MASHQGRVGYAPREFACPLTLRGTRQFRQAAENEIKLKVEASSKLLAVLDLAVLDVSAQDHPEDSSFGRNVHRCARGAEIGK